MHIVFFSNYFNHHQMPLADAFNSIPGIKYTFVTTSNIPAFRVKLGYKKIDTPYVIDSSESVENYNKARYLAVEADVAIFSTVGMNEYIIPRLKKRKLTFEVSERWFKKGVINLFSPNLIKHQLMYYRYGRTANLYMLCCSAFAANDYYMMNSYKNRCYKWAYFTKVDRIDINKILEMKRHTRCRIMWCSRFIKWKHPELCLKLARKLKSDGLDFEINMYGDGELKDNIIHEIKGLGLEDKVHILGNRCNEDILVEMQKHNLFLFTSDQNEGWGAVANEAMSNGCTLIASDRIGCVPFLVKENINGKIFKTNNVDSLYRSTKYLIENRHICENLARVAYCNMTDYWSPQVASLRFITLVNNLLKHSKTTFVDGPCSIVNPIHYD